MRSRSFPALLLAGLFALVVTVTGASAEDGRADDKALFEQRCGGCHLDGGFGTRVLERRVAEGQARLDRRDVLPSALVTTVVRRGIGSMPQIREAELSDEELARIAAYLDKTK